MGSRPGVAAGPLPALPLGSRFSIIAAMRSLPSSVPRFSSMNAASSSSTCGARDLVASCSSFFDQPRTFVGFVASCSAHSSVVAVSSSSGATTRLTMPRSIASFGAELLTEEHDLLRLVHADEPGEQVEEPAVRDQRLLAEHVDVRARSPTR